MRKVKKQKKAETPAQIIRYVERQPAPALIQIAEPPTADKVLALAQRQIDIRKGYIRLIALNLRPEDVLVFGNTENEEVYLPKRIAMSILSWAKVEVHFDGPMQEHRYDSPDGPYIEFVINAIITDGSDREVPVIGNRSTRDEFFGTAGSTWVCSECGKATVKLQSGKYGCNEHPNAKTEKEIRYLPLHDVDIASVRQAAVANLWNHALEAIGLRPTLIDLKEAGVDISRVKRIGFSSKNDAPAGQRKTVSDRTASQSTNDRTTGATHSKTAQPSGKAGPGPEKATIPTELPGTPAQASFPEGLYSVKGTIEKVVPGTASNGSLFRRVSIRGIEHIIFDNKERPSVDSDGKSLMVKTFDLLDHSTAIGQPCEFLCANVTAKGKTIPNIKVVLRIGSFEWELDGTPIIRRDREPGE